MDHSHHHEPHGQSEPRQSGQSCHIRQPSDRSAQTVHHEHGAHRAGWYRNKTVIVAGLLGAVTMASYVVPALRPFRESLFMYAREIWWAILLGLALGGVIERFVPGEYVSHLLAQRGRRTILNAVITGFFMSVCSHGILALAIQLYKKGASAPAVVAFLLASPWANLPLTMVLVGFFGWSRAFYIIAVALIIALTTGTLFQMLEARGMIEKNPNGGVSDPNFSIGRDMARRLRGQSFSWARVRADLQGVWRGAVSLGDMVLWWILIGMGLASAAGAYVPEHFFHHYMGPTLLGMMVTLGVATILEVCSEGTSPLAFEIFRQTGALGNSVVFLMAGVATDYTEIGLLWHNVGKRTAMWLPALAVPQVLLWGAVANLLW